MLIAYLVFTTVVFLFLSTIWKTSDWTNTVISVVFKAAWIWSAIMLIGALVPYFKDSMIRWL